jgi:hypothetical protein
LPVPICGASSEISESPTSYKGNYVKQRGDPEDAGGFPRLVAVALYAPNRNSTPNRV